ncbi:hypothetical protein [Rhizobium sp. TAL182]|uniref:hypothetical protein n=1 Tax=Rhizobium sp. TAL182 TaxID=2020313 RepID=UPI0032B024A7
MADLHHFDLAIRQRVRPKKTAVRKAETDPGNRRLFTQQRQKQEFTLYLVVRSDRSLEKDRSDDLRAARNQRQV